MKGERRKHRAFSIPKQLLVSPLTLLPVRGVQQLLSAQTFRVWLLRDQPEPPPHTASGGTGSSGPRFPACAPTAAPASLLSQNYSKRVHLTLHPLPLPPPSILHPKDHSEPGLP